MSFFSRLNFRAWLIVPLCAVGFLLWIDAGRIQRVESISNTDRDSAKIDAHSPTGYAGGKRWLIVPEHNYHSYQWIAETQQMFAQGEWRVRRVAHENAPIGREVHSASLYRWWLGAIAWLDHKFSGNPLGLAVERAALFADPLLHLLLLVVTTVYVARRFGSVAAGVASLALATLFPFAASFLPGAPDSASLGEICALWSVLPLLGAALQTAKNKNENPATIAARIQRQKKRDFLLAGIAGGMGLWVGPAAQVPVLAGIALGGVIAAVLTRFRLKAKPSGDAHEPNPWILWALSGAITCLLAYLAEYFPDHLDFILEVNHPLYGIAWIGLGGLVAVIETQLTSAKPVWNWRNLSALIISVAAVAALPVTMAVLKTRAFLFADLLDSRLTDLPNGVVANNTAAWLAYDGFSVRVIAAGLPLLFLVPTVWLLARRATTAAQRTALCLAAGPVIVALTFACSRLRWWNLFDDALIVLVVSVAATLDAQFGARARRGWIAAFGLILLAGLLPVAGRAGKDVFSRLEVESLIERGLAHWIADRTGPSGATFLAPPECTASLCFFGGLRGLGTPDWENQDGLAAAARIVSATTPETAQTLLGERGITHIILPSWDVDLDDFARLSAKRPEDTFLNALHQWSIPPWLRALPYHVPEIAGFEGQSVAIFEVTGENNRAAALSRLTEYFLEMNQIGPATTASQSLQRYPGDLGALVAIAQVQQAGSDPAFAKTFETILSTLAGGFDRALPWDRRVSLAVVLAQNGKADLAREQLRRCLEKLDETRLRSLTTGSLFRLQVLGRNFDLPIADPKLRALALELLPTELRSRL